MRGEYCKKFGHNAKQLADYHDALLEVCLTCGKELHYYKHKDGSIDNRRYYQDHLRDFAQPGSKLYEQFYGHLTQAKQKDHQDTASFWERREEDRMENWRNTLKAQGDAHHIKKLESVVKQQK